MKVTKNKPKSRMTKKEIEQWAKIPFKNKKMENVTKRAVAWFESLSDRQKDRLQYELSTSLNYMWWGNKLKVELYKKMQTKNTK